MPYCPVCKVEFEGDLTSCPTCGRDFDEESPEDEQENHEYEWSMIAKIGGKPSADLVKETLESYNIPVAVISESGFFGEVGLNLPSVTGGRNIGQFQIYVPLEFREDAENILNSILGGDWEKVD